MASEPNDRGGVGALEASGVEIGQVERPESEEQLRQLMERASREGLRVMPVGGGTTLGAGRLPERVDIAVDMTGLCRVISLDEKNLNVVVQAGMGIEALNELLGATGRGFVLPVDPPLARRATMGGIYAANMSGPLRLLYGTLRDLALGVEAVGAQGQAVKFGGVTVKNVSGYDITKFLIGSAGSLCIVTRVATRIYPVAEAACLCTADLPGMKELECLQEDLLASVLVPSALVAFPAETDDGGVRLLALFEGHPKAVERQHMDLAEMVRQRGGHCEVSMERGALKGSLGDSVDPPQVDGVLVGVRSAVPLTRGPETLRRAYLGAKEMDIGFKGALLCGTGVLFLYGTSSDEESLGRWMEGIRRTAEELGGVATPILGPRKVLELWGPRVREEIQRLVLSPIKAKLDPKGVLPPLF